MKSRISRLEARAAERASRKAAGLTPVAQNKRALFEYVVEEKFEAGLSLTGPEVKSLRDGNASLQDGYVSVEKGEAWLLNVHIAPYTAGSYNNPDPKRKRKLLLHRREIQKIGSRIQRAGETCVPLSLYFKGPYAKVQVALVTGKKTLDKRETIRRREADREARAAIKASRR